MFIQRLCSLAVPTFLLMSFWYVHTEAVFISYYAYIFAKYRSEMLLQRLCSLATPTFLLNVVQKCSYRLVYEHKVFLGGRCVKNQRYLKDLNFHKPSHPQLSVNLFLPLVERPALVLVFRRRGLCEGSNPPSTPGWTFVVTWTIIGCNFQTKILKVSNFYVIEYTMNKKLQGMCRQ